VHLQSVPYGATARRPRGRVHVQPGAATRAVTLLGSNLGSGADITSCGDAGGRGDRAADGDKRRRAGGGTVAGAVEVYSTASG
jgi:hypothetical protein